MGQTIGTTPLDGQVLVGDSSKSSGFGWAARHSIYPVVKPAIGEYHVGYGGSTSNTTPILGRVYLHPIDIRDPNLGWGGIAYNLAVQGVGGTTPLLLLGLYPDDGTYARPALTAPLAGTTQSYDPTVTGGEKYTAWGSAWTPPAVGRYWFGLTITSGSAFTTAPQVLAHFTATSGMPRTSLATQVSGWTYDTSSSASALPTLTSLTASASAMPVMGLKRAS